MKKKNKEESAHNMLISIIKLQKEKEEKQDIWKNSPYKCLVKLQNNNVGIVGEKFINSICNANFIDAECDGTKTKKIGGGLGDGKILNKTIEIKTALQGTTGQSFQHELGEVPWKSEYMIFLDISPLCMYLTIFTNFNETIYKGNKKLSIFPNKKITWRKGKGAFKFDTSIKINELSIKNGIAIKILPDTTNEEISSFIRKSII